MSISLADHIDKHRFLYRPVKRQMSHRVGIVLLVLGVACTPTTGLERDTETSLHGIKTNLPSSTVESNRGSEVPDIKSPDLTFLYQTIRHSLDEFPPFNAMFQGWSLRFHPEIGQSFQVPETFLLERVGVFVAAPVFVLPGFWEAPDDWNIREAFVDRPSYYRDLPVSISLQLFQSKFGESFQYQMRVTNSNNGNVASIKRNVLALEDLELVHEQEVRALLQAGNGPLSWLKLTTPVELASGDWLIVLRLNSVETVQELLELTVRGVESGNNAEITSSQDEPCNYVRTKDPHPQGQAWFRGRNDYFGPMFAKVDQCNSLGKYELPMNEGDLAMSLEGKKIVQGQP